MSSTGTQRDDRLLAPTRWVSTGIVPVLGAAFVILYLFADRTMQLWAWMVCPEVSAYVIGGGYLAGAYFFTRTSRAREWHRVGVGFVATTVFASLLLLVTVLEWEVFNHDHVSFRAWLLLYVVTPVLLPVLWRNNRRTDPGRSAPAPGDVRVPHPVRLLVGLGGALQLALAAVIVVSPETVVDAWPWSVDVATLRVMGAFVAFPAVTWLCFLFDDRWSSFRITQHTATIGLVLVMLGAVRSRGEFRDDGRFWTYLAVVGVAVALNVVLYVAMERRARRGETSDEAQQALADRTGAAPSSPLATPPWRRMAERSPASWPGTLRIDDEGPFVSVRGHRQDRWVGGGDRRPAHERDLHAGRRRKRELRRKDRACSTMTPDTTNGEDGCSYR